ncbi:MAG: phospholipase C, phosphocholine-specific [Acetobacteraceae bacterium]|nr:phospholipase C, phosphocholine-specific [Acetobacteraceae bacterium]
MAHATTRRGLFKGAMTAAAFAALPPSIQKAFATSAAVSTGTIADVKHIVILMQENRAFDHYYGTMRGVRGFGDPFPHPTVSGQPVWYQKNGPTGATTLPFPILQTKNWAFPPDLSHSFSDQQGAWGQGQASYWPQYKSASTMGYYTGAELPFQFALAQAFTIGDAYHCAVASGTDPNRVSLMSGSSWDPTLAAQGTPSTDAHGEPNNLRCWVSGTWPSPGYSYNLIAANQPFTWPNIADVLTEAGISWRIYQDMNNNWTGAMNGFLAFQSFRTAAPGSTIYVNGMTTWTIADLQAAVQNNTLATVNWVLPSAAESEHPGAPCSPTHGGYFVETVLEALTANPDVWASTIFILNFDENDGYFDHAVAPAVPSYDTNGVLQGNSTVPVAGLYFNNATRTYSSGSYLSSADTISGNLRPWGLGARVPFTVVSPWSKGGWVNSATASHASIGLFLEKWLGVTVPAISAWHRSVLSDLTSFFNFATPNDTFPTLPDLSGYAASDAASKTLPAVAPPTTQSLPTQQTGLTLSRGLPYALNTTASTDASGVVTLNFINTGKQGAVFHVYDQLNLNRIPRRYTVEAGKTLSDNFWNTFGTNYVSAPSGTYNLWVYGPNGFLRTFQGAVTQEGMLDLKHPEIELTYDTERAGIHVSLRSNAAKPVDFALIDNAYGSFEQQTVSVGPNEVASLFLSVKDSGNWYDFSVKAGNGFHRQFAGRMEDGKDHITDPQMGRPIAPYTNPALA